MNRPFVVRMYGYGLGIGSRLLPRMTDDHQLTQDGSSWELDVFRCEAPGETLVAEYSEGAFAPYLDEDEYQNSLHSGMRLLLSEHDLLHVDGY